MTGQRQAGLGCEEESGNSSKKSQLRHQKDRGMRPERAHSHPGSVSPCEARIAGDGLNCCEED